MLPKGLFRSDGGQNYTVTFFLVATLFLLWGFCNGMIDVMDKHFQDLLHLSKAQSAWVQFSHYLGYFVMALPAGLLARKIGYKGGILTGLLLVAIGGLWFVPATRIAEFWAFLLGVCIIAMGLTVLETVANPYTTVLGPKSFSAMRINVAQSFNGLGWIFGPVVGGAFFYDNAGVEAAQQRLYIPYAAVAVLVLVLAAVFFFARIPDLNTEDEYRLDDSAAGAETHSIWKHPHFVGGVAAQFFYVAAQAGIFSFFINYMTSEVPAVPATVVHSWFLKGGAVLHNGAYFINEQGASRLLGVVGFLLFLIGRAIGSAILRVARAHLVLAIYGIINVAACVVVALQLRWISVAAVFASFFFMSVMFPTIFALAISGLGLQAKKASSFIVMAIMGGAILPKLMGHVGDLYNMSIGFLVPMGCFAVVAVYGLLWPKLSKAPALVGGVSLHGH